MLNMSKRSKKRINFAVKWREAVFKIEHKLNVGLLKPSDRLALRASQPPASAWSERPLRCLHISRRFLSPAPSHLGPQTASLNKCHRSSAERLSVSCCALRGARRHISGNISFRYPIWCWRPLFCWRAKKLCLDAC